MNTQGLDPFRELSLTKPEREKLIELFKNRHLNRKQRNCFWDYVSSLAESRSINISNGDELYLFEKKVDKAFDNWALGNSVCIAEEDLACLQKNLLDRLSSHDAPNWLNDLQTSIFTNKELSEMDPRLRLEHIQQDNNRISVINAFLNSRVCSACEGKGVILKYMNWSDGFCFSCNGFGRHKNASTKYDNFYIDRLRKLGIWAPINLSKFVNSCLQYKRDRGDLNSS